MRRTRVGRWCAAVLMTVTLAGCAAATGGGSGGSAAAPVEAPGADALANAGPVELTLWHAMSGANGDVLLKLVNEFNAQHQGKIKANLAFKGQYDDAMSAYKTALKGGGLPDVVQIYDIGTRFMIDSGSVVPIQSFVDKDRHDVSDLQPNITGYYTVDKKLYSMPFNTSMPLLYINKDAFARAGLDPNAPPKTLAEIRAAAEKIKNTPGSGVQYGFGASVYGWFFEQWMASSGQHLCDADNGRSGRANAVNLATEENVELLTWWQKMVNDGLALKLDSNTDNGDNAFSSATVAISLESTGQLGSFVRSAKFPIGTGFFPKVRAGDTGGPIIGGASLWVVGQGKDAAHLRASWELVKFLASKPTQVTWHTGTGYFPISRGALDDPADQQWVTQRPQFTTAINQLRATALTPATQGCSVGVMPQVRKDVENALQAAVLQNQDPKAALTDAQNAANGQIAEYNKSLGG
ncbi:ABC transporter substrate-binding protein [Pseudonocardia acaciae]|uniref:ABC transporter substrate-binding protein n=1 Tax=Pseudonocardia acaciae TaxID=551276 RepID=UPI00048E3D60|nr:ABC transporter substrate-binding protein [Pseudonocardia acaciae]